MKEFVALSRKVNYIPPKLDESELDSILREFELKNDIKEYVLAGERIVVDA